MESSESHYQRYQTISYPHERCEVKSPRDSYNIVLTALNLVKETVCSAEKYIAADIPEVFYYKFPNKLDCRPEKGSCSSDTNSTTSSRSSEETDGRTVTIVNVSLDKDKTQRPKNPHCIEWPAIRGFNLQNCAVKIRDYVDLWKLTPNTKYTVLIKDDTKLLRNKGTRYFVDVVFSSPTPKCPNPLAVAKVHFFIQVPELMPKYYPVMVTYRFEGFKSLYYAVGRKQVRSLEFQQFFIDTILHSKLKFYAEIFHLRYSMDYCSHYTSSEEGEEELQGKCTTKKFSFDDEFTSSDVV